MTHYVHGVIAYMDNIGHSTNIEILEHLQQTYPSLTATTVHRITTRLIKRGMLAAAPVSKSNAMRFDVNTNPHDHFQCSNCDMLRDTTIADKIRPILETSIGDGCQISGNLVITGLCKKCNKENHK